MDSEYDRDEARPVYYNVKDDELNYAMDVKGNRTEFAIALESELVPGEVRLLPFRADVGSEVDGHEPQ